MPHRVTTSPGEAAALQTAGARLVRHAHDMALDLHVASPAAALPDGLSLRAGVEPGSSLARAAFAAYPPGHPDAGPLRSLQEAERELGVVLAGFAAGAVLPEPSAVATDATGAVVGAVIVTRLPPEPWWWAGGPWIAEVFVVPNWQCRGLGGALLGRAIASSSAAGEGRIGLRVTDGNPAERLYRRLGFRRRRTVYVLDD